MKKLVLLCSISLSALAVNAQLYLSGASPYVQNFNAIAGGIPTGWYVYNSSTPTSIGVLNSLNTSASFGVYDTANLSCTGSVRAAGFKNFASGNTATVTDSCSVQAGRADRALGVRQTGGTATGGTGLDSGAAFVVKMANTSGMSSLNFTFKLQSLDRTSPRITTWKVQYGLGLSPTTWNDIAVTGTMTTGGNTFTNNTISGSLPASVNNQSQPVTIRIVTLEFSSSSISSGNRTSTAIDDFNLNWTGSATMGLTEMNYNTPSELVVLGDATAEKITFGINTTSNNSTISLFDLAGRTIRTESVGNNDNFTMSNLNVAPGMYIATLNNGVQSVSTKVMVK